MEPFVVFGFHLLGYDLWFFASHIVFHKVPWAWEIHKIHHEKRFPIWKDTYHAHWIEGPIQSLGFALPWLLGYWSWTASFFAFAVAQIRGLARHDPRMNWLVGNHHLLHHQLYTVNYGEPWLDKVWGTHA